MNSINSINSIKEELKHNKPNISDSTIKTYCSLIKNMFNKYSNDNDELNKHFFIDNYKSIIEELEKENLNSRKTRLASIVVLLGDEPINEKYKYVMMGDIKTKSDNDNNQEMNEKQIKNKLTQDDINKVFKMYYNKVIGLKITIDKELNKDDFNIYQSYILLCLISGLYIPPRRLLDYTDLKIIDDEKNNFYNEKKQTLNFRKYKTEKKYGEQVFNINDKLNRILKKYKSYLQKNNIEYFFTHNNKPLNTSQLNLWINKIFSNGLNKKIQPGINSLRHSYLSNKYKNIPALKDMIKTAEQMGHDIKTGLLYVQKEPPKTIK